MESLLSQAPQFAEILWLNVILSGDNAMVIGLLLSIVLMGVLGGALARLRDRYKFIA